jgi:hypothetical protein
MTGVRLVAAGLVLAAASAAMASVVFAEERFSPYVDEAGSISFPVGFRLSMVHLGSWFVPDGDASGFHDVYTERDTIEAYRRTGEFPDGATLVKELRASEARDYTTGAGVSHATAGIKQWFVMIKDTKGRFPGNPLWGEGWGWALYKPGDKNNNAATDYGADCLGCHVPAKRTDWVYTEAYPILSSD